MQTWDITLPSGVVMPAPGLGTWRMGERGSAAEAEIDALRHAYDAGFRHFDTAEMYGDGSAEEVLGQALAPLPRNQVFVTSKFYPHHARPGQMVGACEASLTRLGLDHLDLYLLHWPGSTPFEDTLEGARRLLDAGKIRAFGVSNFDTDLMEEVIAAGAADLIQANQVMYNPARRGIEFDLLPLLERQSIACIAYTPIEPDTISSNNAFCTMADQAGLSPAQLALAWQTSRRRTCPIPKSAQPANIDALAAATEVTLSGSDLAAIDAAFPPPERPEPLDII